MAGVKSFEDLEVWKASRKLCKEIYIITNHDKFSKDYSFKDQVRRSAISVLSNISEGFERTADNQFSYFLTIAKGSAGELRSQLYIAFDLGYIKEDEFKSLFELVSSISKMLYGLNNYIKERKSIKIGK